MPYNKNQFRKVNDKKVLHKVKSHWVAVSLSLLMALGGTAVAGQAVHADNNVSLNNQNNVDHQMNVSNDNPEIDFDNNVFPSRHYLTSPVSAESQVTPTYVNGTANNIVSTHLLGASNNSSNNVNDVVSSLESLPDMGPSTPASASNSVPNNNVPSNSASDSNGSTPTNSASSSPASSSDFVISYTSGDNGSAASYHAKASADQNLYQINSSLAEHYINSLNTRFGTETVSLNNNYTSLKTKYNHDQSVADNYFNVVNSPDYSQEVSSLAAKNGQTASNYVQSISYHASSFASNLSQGNNLKSQMAVVNSYAQLISNLHSNSNLRINYSLKAQSADAALNIENAYSKGFTSIANALNTASNAAGEAMLSAIVSSMNASASNAIANINVNQDSSTVDSLARALSFGSNTFFTGSDVSNFANTSFKADQDGNLILRGLNNTHSNVAYEANSSDPVYNLLNDVNIRTTYNSKANSYDNVISSAKSAQASLSGAISSANANVQSESGKYSAISSAAAFYDALSDPQVGLNNIFGSEVATHPASSVSVSTVDSAVTYLLNNAVNGSTEFFSSASVSSNTVKSAISVAVPYFVSDVANADHLIDSAGNVENVQELAMDLGSGAHDIGSALSKGLQIINGYSNQVKNGLTFNQLWQKIQKFHSIYPSAAPNIYHWSQIVLAPIANNATLGNQQFISPVIASKIFSNNGSDSNRIQGVISKLVNSPLTQQILNLLTPSQGTQVRGNLLNPQSYAAASNAVSVYTNAGQNNLSYDVSAISSATISASAAANSAASASMTYDSSAEVGVALAGSLLGSYDNTVYNDKQSLSTAQNSLTDFYNQYAPGYTSASSTASSASAAVPTDAKLAQAYGIHVYNYAPKYITAIKNVSLYGSLDGNKEVLSQVNRGQQLAVNGVGFSKNGDLSYAVTYNGKDGYVTADPNATKNTFLFATQNNRVTITAVRQLSEYTSPVFSKDKQVKSVPVGQKLSGTVVSEDNTYGGFTRIRLDDGNYITANTSWIDIDFNNNNSNSDNNSSNVIPQHKVNFD